MTKPKVSKKIILEDDIVKALETLTDSLDKIVANKDGGKVVVQSEGRPDIVFSIPPKGERKPL